MKRVFLLTLVLCAAIAVAENPRPVSVLISATDASGNPVKDLAKDNISVLDNNAQAAIADIKPVAQAPLSVGIVLSASKRNFAKEQAAAIDLINKLLHNENDRAFVINAGGERVWAQKSLEWQADRDTLIKEVNSLDKNTGMPDAFNFDWSIETGDTAMSSMTVGVESQQAKGTNVFDVALSMMMADKRPARRVLIMFRNPWREASGLDQRNLEYVDKEHARIIAAAQQLHVSIYTIGMDEANRNTASTVPDIGNNYGMNQMGDQEKERDRRIAIEKDRLYSGGRANVQRLADGTGGQSWWKEDHNFKDSVAGIVNGLEAQYVLTFIPASTTPGAHALKVSSARASKVAAPSEFSVGAAVPKTAEGK